MWISRKKFEALMETSKALLVEIEQMKERWQLIAIERNGRLIKFVFSKGLEVYTVETVMTLSADVEEWERKLIN